MSYYYVYEMHHFKVLQAFQRAGPMRHSLHVQFYMYTL